MKTLLFKEKKILFYINLLNIIIILLSSLPYAIFRSKGNFDMGLILIIWITTYLYIESSINQGNISNDDILLRSMPIERDLVVKSKYISVLLMILRSFVIFLTILLLSMNSLYSGNTIFEVVSIWKVLVTVSILLLFLSLSLLAYYFKKGVGKKKGIGLENLINIVPFLFPMLAIWKGRGDSYLENILSKFDNPIFVVFIFAIALLLYFISYLISVRMYRKKEF